MAPYIHLCQFLDLACVDTDGWENGAGRDCNSYASNNWCENEAIKEDWTSGSPYNYPENNCCVCGKRIPKGNVVPLLQ